MVSNRVLLITGGSSGIGAAAARLAAAAGFRLALAARSIEPLIALRDELGGELRVFADECDVRSEASVEHFVANTVTHFGTIDALFANAGIGGRPGGFASGDIANWRELLNTNVIGLATTIQKALPHLRHSKGQIVITGSTAGRRVVSGSMYSVSKWAANALAYNLREELSGSGIRVSLIEPGVVNTPILRRPAEHALRPQDVARSVLFALQAPTTVEVHDLVLLPTQAE